MPYKISPAPSTHTLSIPVLATHALALFLIFFNALADEILTGQESLEFHGYFRAGLGMSESGTTQARFQAPGARSSYRLGNEPDTNIELQLSYNYKVGQSELDNSYVRGVFMLDGYQPHGQTNDFTISHLAQGYLSFNAFFNNDIKLWLGRRYYDRKSIHILDYTWLNPGQFSQAGLGIEDISTGTAKINVALFRYEDTFDISGTAFLLNSTRLDTRWHDLNISDNLKLTLWADLTLRHELTTSSYANQSGYGLGGWLDYDASATKNTTVLIYQIGSSINQGNYNPKPVREDLGWDLENATSFEFSNTLTFEPESDYAVQWAVLYRHEDHGLAGNSKLDWYNTGVRPIIYFSRHMNIAFEAGFDRIEDDINNLNGSLSKFTTALQISADRGFFSRPVMRFFVTFADWSDDFKGLIGNTPGDAPYANETQGWSIGAQAETWW